MPESADYPPVYAALRARVRGIVESVEPALLDAIAPATPAWRVRDVLAHLVGVPADVISGNIAGAATDPWTAAQVDARREQPVTAILDEWDDAGSKLESLMPAIPVQIVGQMLFDAVTHEHDVRHALARCGAQDSDAVMLSAQWGAERAPEGTAGRTAAVEIEWPEGSVTLGEGAPTATVRVASSFEFMRAVSGRRSSSQIKAYAWRGEAPPESVLLASLFTVSPIDIVE